MATGSAIKLPYTKLNTDWESEFSILLRYTERIEKMNDELIKQTTTLTALMEKLMRNGN